MRLLLVRHGQIQSNVDDILDTVMPGPELTAVGRRQAQDLVERLAGESINQVYTSVARRAQATAAPIAAARGLTVQVVPGLHEITAGEFEGRSDPFAVGRYVDVLNSWSDPPPYDHLPGGETKDGFLTRFDAGIGRICEELDEATTALVVAHGAAIPTWIGLCARNSNLEFLQNQELSNTGMAIVEGGLLQGWTLVSWEGTNV